MEHGKGPTQHRQEQYQALPGETGIPAPVSGAHGAQPDWRTPPLGTASWCLSLRRYDRNKLTLKDIRNCQYVACMNPTAGSFTIDPRLQVRGSRRAGRCTPARWLCWEPSPEQEGWVGSPAVLAGCISPCGTKLPPEFLPLAAAALLHLRGELPWPGGSADRVRHHPGSAPGPAEDADGRPEPAAPAASSSAG